MSKLNDRDITNIKLTLNKLILDIRRHPISINQFIGEKNSKLKVADAANIVYIICNQYKDQTISLTPLPIGLIPLIPIAKDLVLERKIEKEREERLRSFYEIDDYWHDVSYRENW